MAGQIVQHSIFAVTLCGLDLVCTLVHTIWTNRATPRSELALVLREMLFRWVIYWILAIVLLVL